MKSYKDDPLWKDVLAKEAEAGRQFSNAINLMEFPASEEKLADVVLSYFADKPMCQMKEFADCLQRFADKRRYAHTFWHEYGCSMEKNLELSRQADEELDRLMKKRAQERQGFGKDRNRADCSSSKEKPLDDSKPPLNDDSLSLQHGKLPLDREPAPLQIDESLLYDKPTLLERIVMFLERK